MARQSSFKNLVAYETCQRFLASVRTRRLAHQDPTWELEGDVFARRSSHRSHRPHGPSNERNKMKVKDISTRDPQCISPEASLTEAARKMRILDIGMLPVCENDRLVGTVTDRDITVRAVAEGLDPKTVKVRQVMTQEVVYCFENRSVEEAAQLMEEKKIRRLPVLDQEKHLVGIVSIGDLAARAHERKLAGEVLEHIAQRARPTR